MMRKAVEFPFLVTCQSQLLRRFGAAHDALKYLLAAHYHADRAAELACSDRCGNGLLADAEFRSEASTDIPGYKADIAFFDPQTVGQFGDIVIWHLERCMDGELIVSPFRDGCVWFHGCGRMPLGRNFYIDRMRGPSHGGIEIALIDGLVFLLFWRNLMGIERRSFVDAVFHLEMLRRIARLFERFCDHYRDRLTPIANRCRVLFRRLVSRALRCAGCKPLIVHDSQDAGHRKDAVLVDGCDFTPGYRCSDQNAFGHIIDLVFCRIRGGAGNLGQTVDTGKGLADDTLLHPIQPVRRDRFILLQMRAHISVSVASAITAARVRRASGILKSFSPYPRAPSSSRSPALSNSAADGASPTRSSDR